jgi:hypothetical protein
MQATVGDLVDTKPTIVQGHTSLGAGPLAGRRGRDDPRSPFL